MDGRHSWYCRAGCIGLLVAAGCGSPDPRTQGGSEGGGLGPGSEEGAPCEQEIGCGVGLFCDDGSCAACGSDTPAPGKLCFEARTLVSEHGASLEVAHLQASDAVLADNRDVHVRMLFPDGAGSLREQWFGASAERLGGELVDLDGDGFDEFSYCSIHAIGQCQVLSFEMDLLTPYASVHADSAGIDGVPPHGSFPGRLLGADYQREEWRSWLLFPNGAVEGAPLPIFPTNPVLAGDFDGDGEFEVAAPVDDHLDVLELDAAGIGYEVVATAPIPVDTELVAVTDLDDDAREDVLLGTPGEQLVIARLGEDGELALSEPIPLALQPRAMAIGDLDGDGRVDLATKDQTAPPAEGDSPTFDRILVLAQTEPGVFDRRYIRYPSDVGSIAIFDVDQDGHMDLVVSGREGIYQMLANP